MNVKESRPPVSRRVLLVEDEAMSRSLLTQVLSAAGFDMVACANAEEAIEGFDRWDPDALVTDIDLGPGPNGLDLILALAPRNPHLPVVVLSNYAITPDYRHELLAKAVYLRKRDLEDPDVLLDALEDVLRERTQRGAQGDEPCGALAGLTRSQIQTLRMIAQGLSNQEIADRRGCNLRSAEQMVQRTFVALGLGHDPAINSRVAATRIYIAEAGMPAAEG